ncbi:MAG: hypothetical protein H7222_06490 [Methylotenera sp.]|nr:hypothetical protein [Oligoflexia bacterium]
MLENLTKLIGAFPESFTFYHLGNVEKQAPIDHVQALDLKGRSGVSFNLYGDTTGLILFLFDEGLDGSTYTEMGNVLASRMANQLSLEQGWDVMISPPRFLTSLQLQSQVLPALQALEKSGQPVPAHRYHHQLQQAGAAGPLIELQLLVLMSSPGLSGASIQV